MPYKPKWGYYGQFSTDVLIETYFPNKEEGVCIEVGAADGVKGSNTLYFEEMGWHALCIEPIPMYYHRACKVREHVVNCACGSVDDISQDFTIFNIGDRYIESSLSSLSPDYRLVKEYEHLINSESIITVETRTLDHILEQNNIDTHINFISIDTEGTELDVLHGLDLNRWDVDLLVIENNYEDRTEIRDYLENEGYKRDSRWMVNEFFTKR